MRRSAGLVVALATLTACAETPIDVVEREDDGDGAVSSGGGSGEGGDVGAPAGGLGGTSGGASPGGAPSGGYGGAPPPMCEPVTEFVPGRYRLSVRSSYRCLTRGSVTYLGGMMTYEPQLERPCGFGWTEDWEVTRYVPDNSFVFMNRFDRRVLDVATGSADVGTRLVLWYLAEPALLASRGNQRFYVRPREDHWFELAPAHAPTSCVSEFGDGTVIFPCEPTREDQQWMLVPDCP